VDPQGGVNNSGTLLTRNINDQASAVIIGDLNDGRPVDQFTPLSNAHRRRMPQVGRRTKLVFNLRPICRPTVCFARGL
jgi:hypothetical protein